MSIPSMLIRKDATIGLRGAAIPLALAIVPLAHLIAVLVRTYVDVPFFDQWELVPRLQHLSSGTLTFHDLWMQHNEHRPVFPVIVMLALARGSDWNTTLEIVVNVALGAGIFAVFARYLWTERVLGRYRAWLLPVFAMLLFSLVQWENWTWGWQMMAFMGTLASLCGAYLLSRSGASPRAFAGAVLCGIWSAFSFGSGLMYWIAAFPGVWFSARARLVQRLAIWTAVAAAVYGTYFYDFHRPPQPSLLSTFTSLAAMRAFALYVVTYLGAPIAWYGQAAAAWTGAALLIACAWLCWRLWPRRRESAVLFPALVALQTVGTAALSGLGRAWMGVDQALTSRYCTFTLPMWCATAALAWYWCISAPRAERTAYRIPVVAALVLATLLSGFFSSRLGGATMTGRNETLRFARRGLIVGRSNALLKMLYPDVAVVRDRRQIILRLHLSVFRASIQPTYPLPDHS